MYICNKYCSLISLQLRKLNSLQTILQELNGTFSETLEAESDRTNNTRFMSRLFCGREAVTFGSQQSSVMKVVNPRDSVESKTGPIKQGERKPKPFRPDNSTSMYQEILVFSLISTVYNCMSD